MLILTSKQDASVNFISDVGTGYFESRYVRRPNSNYFIAYLSSQSGCNRGCKMCHLTATNQTQYMDANYDALNHQLIQVMGHYQNLSGSAKFAHINFMARGEPLANRYIREDGDWILSHLCDYVARELPVKVNISTIMPLTVLQKPLVSIFRYSQPQIYYSLYSLRKEFREKWLPGAMDPYDALEQLAEYQELTGRPVKIHHAFIHGENDSADEVREWATVVNDYLKADFNLVRYNPPNATSRESPLEVINRNMDIINSKLSGTVKIVDRVGFDVHASCGTFFSGEV